jgi:hypothetical protein
MDAAGRRLQDMSSWRSLLADEVAVVIAWVIVLVSLAFAIIAALR